MERGAAGMSLLLAIAATWGAAIHAYPVDKAIVAGMISPECGAVGWIPAGAMLFARLTDSDICRPYFLYRSTQRDAADDAHFYMKPVMQARVPIALAWCLLLNSYSTKKRAR
jgi:hypothetical protein